MFAQSNGYSLSDIAAANGNNRNGGAFGDDGWWIILLFLFGFGNNGWGNGGNGRTTDMKNSVIFTDSHDIYYTWHRSKDMSCNMQLNEWEILLKNNPDSDVLFFCHWDYLSVFMNYVCF